MENPLASLEKLCHQESVEVAQTVLRGIMRAPMGLSHEKPDVEERRRRGPQGFAA